MDINDAWKSTCRVLLRDEVGELEEFAPYLSKYIEPVERRPSALSRKPVFCARTPIDPRARHMAYDEMEAYNKSIRAPKLESGQIRDMDSIVSALQEQFVYSASIVLGNSSECENCDRCANLHYARACTDCSDSKYNAYSSLSRVGDFVFGSSFLGECKSIVRVFFAWRAVRSFECHRLMKCADCYLSANLDGCSDCFFCFNLRNRRHCIGNLQLEKEEYHKRKEELLEQICSELRGKKQLDGIVELLSGSTGPLEAVPLKYGADHIPYFNRQVLIPKQIEKEFEATTRLVLGKTLFGLPDYEQWLCSNVRLPVPYRSCVSGKPCYYGQTVFHAPMSGRFCSLEESFKEGEKALSKEQAARLTLGNFEQMLKPIAVTTPETREGKLLEVHEIDEGGDSSFCYGGMYWTSKNCCYNYWIRDGEDIFGSDMVFYSKSCINCYHSNHIARCFEVSEALQCEDCYFCHNVENCMECMFCFNVKAKRYAIGNVEYPKEEYLRMKKMILEEISAKLQKEKTLELNIYNIGAKK